MECTSAHDFGASDGIFDTLKEKVGLGNKFVIVVHYHAFGRGRRQARTVTIEQDSPKALMGSEFITDLIDNGPLVIEEIVFKAARPAEPYKLHSDFLKFLEANRSRFANCNYSLVKKISFFLTPEDEDAFHKHLLEIGRILRLAWYEPVIEVNGNKEDNDLARSKSKTVEMARTKEDVILAWDSLFNVPEHTHVLNDLQVVMAEHYATKLDEQTFAYTKTGGWNTDFIWPLLAYVPVRGDGHRLIVARLRKWTPTTGLEGFKSGDEKMSFHFVPADIVTMNFPRMADIAEFIIGVDPVNEGMRDVASTMHCHGFGKTKGKDTSDECSIL
jgi:hypothetical protein